MFRIVKLVFVGGASGQNCEMTAASRAMRCKRRVLRRVRTAQTGTDDGHGPAAVLEGG